jgi:hypothetical protein
MTLEQLAEQHRDAAEDFLCENIDPGEILRGDYGLGCKNAFLSGAALALEFAEWKAENDVQYVSYDYEITGYHYWDIEGHRVNTQELFERFLTCTKPRPRDKG